MKKSNENKKREPMNKYEKSCRVAKIGFWLSIPLPIVGHVIEAIGLKGMNDSKEIEKMENDTIDTLCDDLIEKKKKDGDENV